MTVSETIKLARERKGLKKDEVAEKAGLSIHEYGDIEDYDDEAETVVHLRNLKALCAALDLDLFDIFSLEKPRPSFPHFDLNKRDTIILHRRKALNLTQDELGDRVGFSKEAIQEMETDSDYLESWCVKYIVSLATALNLPPWVLIGK